MSEDERAEVLKFVSFIYATSIYLFALGLVVLISSGSILAYAGMAVAVASALLLPRAPELAATSLILFTFSAPFLYYFLALPVRWFAEFLIASFIAYIVAVHFLVKILAFSKNLEN